MRNAVALVLALAWTVAVGWGDGAARASERSDVGAPPKTLAVLEVCASGCPYTSIQVAIDAASNGDTVLVHDGTYAESIVFGDAQITVRSVNGPEVTTIDGGGAASVVEFPTVGTLGGDIRALEGFTIANGEIGVYALSSRDYSGSPTVTDCIIRDNTQEGVVAFEVYSIGGPLVLLSDCHVIDNAGSGITVGAGVIRLSGTTVANNAGHGILVSYWGEVDVTASTIEGNMGDGINAERSPTSIRVASSSVSCNGGDGIRAFQAYSGSGFVVEDSRVENNSGRGIFATEAPVTIAESTIAGNGSDGVVLRSTISHLVNSTIAGNLGAGVSGNYTYPGGVGLFNCTVAGNSGFGLSFESSPNTVTSTIVWGNNTLMGGAQIDGSPTVSYSDVEGGFSGVGNLDAQPLFATPRTAAEAPASDGDYHLRAGSPCIDTGIAIGAPPHDIDGDPRPIGGGWDIGSDEFDPAPIFADGFESSDVTRWSHTSNEITVVLPGGVALVMVRIPAGTFIMGAADGERGAGDNEYPNHQVTLGQDYYMGKYEVTQAQWQAVMGANPAHTWGVGDDIPVYFVSWNDVAGPGGFVELLNQHLSDTSQPGAGLYRLPTEAEWERAARAGTQTRYSFGDNLTCDDACGPCGLASAHMWWCGNEAVSAAKAVGQRQPNAFGLHDMHGNVGEWVADWYGPYTADPQTDPTGPATGTTRVERVGAWLLNAGWCRAATRGGREVTVVLKRTGFRLARSL